MLRTKTLVGLRAWRSCGGRQRCLLEGKRLNATRRSRARGRSVERQVEIQRANPGRLSGTFRSSDRAAPSSAQVQVQRSPAGVCPARTDDRRALASAPLDSADSRDRSARRLPSGSDCWLPRC